MSEWQPIETAPKDGTRILFGGCWKPFDILPGGQWHEAIFSWSSIYADGTRSEWLGESFQPPEHWHVEWTHWHPLPSPPNHKSRSGDT